MSDIDAAALLQDHITEQENEKKLEEKKKELKKIESIKKDEPSIVALAAQYAQNMKFDDINPAPAKEEQTDIQMQSQAALNDVQIMIPDGMQVKSHKD